MRLITRRKILITILSITAIFGGTFFLVYHSTKVADVLFRNSEVLYAEVPASTTSTTTAPTVKMKVPILVYHIVRPSFPTDTESVRRLAHTPETFDAEMKYLGDAGYHVISFATLEDYFKNGTQLPSNPIVISFDDGWSDQYEYAFPILKKYHYTATFFVFTNPIGTRGFMTWDNLREMRDAGMTIAAHSRSHPFLTKITDPAILWKEVYGSKEVIEKQLDITVKEFAYPFGQYNPEVEAAVVKAGYVVARGDVVGKNQVTNSLFELGALNAPTTTEKFARRFPSMK